MKSPPMRSDRGRHYILMVSLPLMFLFFVAVRLNLRAKILVLLATLFPGFAFRFEPRFDSPRESGVNADTFLCNLHVFLQKIQID